MASHAPCPRGVVSACYRRDPNFGQSLAGPRRQFEAAWRWLCGRFAGGLRGARAVRIGGRWAVPGICQGGAPPPRGGGSIVLYPLFSTISAAKIIHLVLGRGWVVLCGHVLVCGFSGLFCRSACAARRMSCSGFGSPTALQASAIPASSLTVLATSFLIICFLKELMTSSVPSGSQSPWSRFAVVCAASRLTIRCHWSSGCWFGFRGGIR